MKRRFREAVRKGQRSTVRKNPSAAGWVFHLQKPEILFEAQKPEMLFQMTPISLCKLTLCGLGQGSEAFGIVHSHVGQNLAVENDVSLL